LPGTLSAALEWKLLMIISLLQYNFVIRPVAN
jgi:hypothetical protein